MGHRSAIRVPARRARRGLAAFSGWAMSGPGRLGLRAEKRTFGVSLTLAAPARVVRKPAPNRLVHGVIWTVVANQRLRRSDRLRSVFRN